MTTNDLLQKASKIKCLICDVDGVMTDGLLYLDNHHNELKTFHVHDGVGLKLLLAVGIEIAVITGSKNAVVDHRMKQLGITHYFKNQQCKRQALRDVLAGLQLTLENIAYIGDDLPDIPLLQQVGFSIAVANAIEEVKSCADWQTTANGGRGAVREACEFILKAQNKYELAVKLHTQDA